jgi:L-ascorbate metabolism protein UlaG (beta-lactamase superfamily)
VKIIWLGHSAFRIENQDAVILVDPFLRDNPSFPSAHFDTAISGVTHVAITHGHFDHVGDAAEIAKTNGAKVLCNYDLGQVLAGQGVETLELANTGGTVPFDGFTVTMVEAKHSAAMMVGGTSHATGSANGLIFHFGTGHSIYHMGDTDIFGDMALINELHKPKIGIVPIGDRLTMGPAVAAMACRRFFDFDTVIPCHHGTFDMLTGKPEDFQAAMEEHADRVHVPEVGEVITV